MKPPIFRSGSVLYRRIQLAVVVPVIFCDRCEPLSTVVTCNSTKLWQPIFRSRNVPYRKPMSTCNFQCSYRNFSLVDISWKIKKYLNIGSEAKLKENLKVVDEFVYKVIQIKSEQMNNPKDDFFVKNEDILSRFMQMENRDPKYFRDIIMNYILAGKDPIAVSVTCFIYMLCKHPQVQDKVAKDIKEATNMKEEMTNVADFEACVSDDALEKMQYLQAALVETIRLYPALALYPKICFSDDVLPDGCIVKKGDMISYMPYAKTSSRSSIVLKKLYDMDETQQELKTRQ